MRVVIDTNLLVSFLIGKILKEIGKLFYSKKLSILTSEEQKRELHNVFAKPKLQKYFTVHEKKVFFRLLERRSIFIKIMKNIKKCRDEKDNFILDITLNGNAAFIVTGDNDLLALKEINGIKIITYSTFRDKLSKLEKKE